MKLFDLLSAQRRFVYLAVAIATVAGIWTALSLPSAIYPELLFPRITIVAEGTALGAREVVFAVARPIEEAVTSVQGVRRVTSRSIRGSSEIQLYFDEKMDMQVALQQTTQRVTQAQQSLPAGRAADGRAPLAIRIPDSLVQSRGRRSGDALRSRALSAAPGAVARARRGARATCRDRPCAKSR